MAYFPSLNNSRPRSTWSSTWYGLFVFSRSIAWSKSPRGQGRFVAFQVEPGPQAIEMGQPRLELDGAIQLFEGQVQLVQPAVGLGQVDIGLVRLRLPLDRRFQVGDGVFESLLPDAQNPAIDGEHIAGIVIEGQLRGLLEVGIGRAPRLQLLLSEAPQQIKPDKIGALRQTGAEQRPGLGGPPLPQQANRIEILRPEMAWLALEHLIEFLDRLAEFLATIQLIRHQEVIENIVQGAPWAALLGLRRLRLIAEHVQVACPPQVKSPGRRSEPPGLFEETQGLSQVLFLFGRLPVGCGLCLGLGKNQQKLIAISQDLGLLSVAQVGIEFGASLLLRRTP